MSLLQAAVANFGFYVLLQFAILPKLHRRLSGANAANAFPVIATLLIAELARAASLIVAASLGLVLGFLWLTPIFASYGSQHQLAQSFELLRHLREQIEHIDKWWGIATIGILGLALWIAVKREAKHQASKAIEIAFEELKSHAQANGLSDLPSTPEMQALEAEIEKRRSKIAEIVSGTSNTDGAEADPKRNPELARLIGEIEALDNWRAQLDISRRLDVGGAISKTIQSEREAPERSYPLLLSNGFFKLISATSRVLTIASLALLAPALISVASGEIADITQSAIVRVHDLILKQSIKEAEESWTHALEPGPEKRELSKADEVLIDQLSQQFQTYVQQQNSGLVRGSVEVGRRLAQNSARERILQNFASSKPNTVTVKGASAEQGSQSQIVKDIVSASAVEGPQHNGLREQFRKELSDQAKQAKPQAWEAFRTKATAALRSVATPMASEELSSKLFAEALNALSQTVFGTDDASRAFSHLASTLAKPGDIVERSSELRKLTRDRFLNEISAHSALGSPRAPLIPGTTIPVRNPIVEESVQRMAEQMESQLAAADSFDEAPFEYPNIKNWMTGRVSQGILTDESQLEAKKTMADLREFTVLQRFFRLALEGKFGDNFPLDALVRLSQVKPRAQQPPVRTPVWNAPSATAQILAQNKLDSLIEPLGLKRDLQLATTQSEICPNIEP